jgi:glutamine cyclotransferase
MTWQDHIAILRDPSTLAEQRRVPLDGEGWGLCHDGGRLVQSRGDNHLLFRDPVTFAGLGEVVVAGQWSTARLGELECVVAGGRPQVWANPQGTDWLLRIDPADGAVTAVADLGRLAVEEIPTRREQVIGGIAAVPFATDEFWVTGRGWAHRYRIRLQPRP